MKSSFIAGAIALALAAIPAAVLAQYLPVPDPVPDGIVASERKSLETQYEILLELQAKLDPSISEHESLCTSVDPRAIALMAECAENKEPLSKSIVHYFGALADYKSQLASAKATALAEAEAYLQEWVWANWSKAPSYITIDPSLLRDPKRLKEWMQDPAVAAKIRRWHTDAMSTRAKRAWTHLARGYHLLTDPDAAWRVKRQAWWNDPMHRAWVGDAAIIASLPLILEDAIAVSQGILGAGKATGGALQSSLTKRPSWGKEIHRALRELREARAPGGSHYDFPIHVRSKGKPNIPKWLFRENPYKQVVPGRETWIWMDAEDVWIRRNPNLDKELKWILTGEGRL